jgi:hypothetical protein
VGSACAPVGGGEVCVCGAGVVEAELFVGAGVELFVGAGLEVLVGAGAGGVPPAGGEVWVVAGAGVEEVDGGGVDDCAGGVDDCAGEVVPDDGGAVSACARPANNNSAMKINVAANNMRRPSLAEATTTGTRSFGDRRLSGGRPPAECVRFPR